MPDARSNQSPQAADGDAVRANPRKTPPQGGAQPFRAPLFGCRKRRHQPHQPPISSELREDMIVDVPLAGLSFGGAVTTAEGRPVGGQADVRNAKWHGRKHSGSTDGQQMHGVHEWCFQAGGEWLLVDGGWAHRC